MRSPPGVTDVLYAETLYPRLHFGWSELVSVRDSRFKLIRGRQPELDPTTARIPARPETWLTRIGTSPRVLDQIASRIASAAAAPARSAGVDRDAASRLQALGYFSGSPPPTTPGPLADPRDKTQSFRTCREARQQLEEHRDAGAIAALQQLVESDPDLEPAHRLLRDAWISGGQSAEAVRWLEQQLARRPDDVRLLIDLAVIERQGRPHRSRGGGHHKSARASTGRGRGARPGRRDSARSAPVRRGAGFVQPGEPDSPIGQHGKDADRTNALRNGT